jgi:transcriptional regulator with XRE-family HTH domain
MIDINSDHLQWFSQRFSGHIKSDHLQWFSQRFSALIRERNLTQSDVADLLEVSQQTISNLTSGKKVPSIKLLGDISNLFNVSTDDLLGENVNRNRITVEKQKAIDDLVETIKTQNISVDAINALARFVDAMIISRSGESK